MTIPKSYEALAADLASEKILSKTLLGQKEAYMMLADKGRLDLSESKAREDALLEGLSRLADDYCEKFDDILDLQQRLTVAEQFVQKMVDCTKGKDSIATGYLSDILALLKTAAEGEGS